MSRTVYALDFETYYDRVCSIVTLGLDKYVRHPDFDAYLVTVAGSDGYRFAGHPSQFPWHVLEGQTVVSHNAAFDHGVYNYLAATGKVPQVTPHQWECSSDLSAYLGVPRNLAGASASLLRVEVNKDVRDQMKGQRWESMTPEFQDEVRNYAIKDAELCLRLWLEHSEVWPEKEREISRLTRESCWKGLYIDQAGLSEDIATLNQVLEDTQKRLPWSANEDAAILSTKAFRDACEACGVEPPPSLNKQDEATKAWVEAHPEITWLRDMWDYRSACVLSAKLESMLARARDEDGRMGYGLKYAGAHTLRDSGDSGVNVQNLPRTEVLGVNLRSRITAAPGNMLVACDLGAIEPRSLTYLAKDFTTLEAAKKVSDWYEAQARAWGLFSAEGTLKATDQKLRHMIKGMAIGLGYKMSAPKFSAVTKMPLPEAEATVALFRAKNPKIVQLWSKLDLAIRRAAGGDFNLMLPSGRPIRYRSVRLEGNSPTAVMVRNGKFMRLKVWPGLAVENCLGADTLVLTLSGWKPLVSVTKQDRVWDGQSWVEHDGVITKGKQPVVDVLGIRATPDHQFLCKNGWTPAHKCVGLSYASYYHPTEVPQMGTETYPTQRLDRSPEWAPDHTAVGRDRREEQPLESAVRLRGRVPFVLQHPSLQLKKAGSDCMLPEMPVVDGYHPEATANTRDVAPPSLCCLEVDAGSLSSPDAPSMEELRGARDYNLSAVGSVVSDVLGRYEGGLREGAGFGPGRQQQRILPGELSLGDPNTEFEKQTEFLGQPDGHTDRHSGARSSRRDTSFDSLLQAEPRGSVGEGLDQIEVYDLLNAGPRHRFTVLSTQGPIVVANCTQAFARDVFMDRVLAVRAAGLPVVLRVHDEVVCEVPEADAKDAAHEMERIMKTSPDWCPDLPLAAEAKFGKTYADAK